MHINPRRIVPFVVVVLLAAAGGWWWFNGRTADAATDLTATGTIETTQIQIAPEIGGRVKTVTVDEGDRVSAGTVVVTFDTALLQAQRDQAAASLAAAKGNHAAAQAALNSAQAQLDQLRAGARPQERAAQQEAVDAAEQQVEVVRAQVEQARSTWQGAVAQRDQAAAKLAQVEEGARAEQLNTALAQMKQAEAAVRLAQSDYDEIKWNSSITASPQALALEKATLNLEIAKDNYEALLKGATTPERDQARAAVAQATAGVSQAAAGVTQAEAALAAAEAQARAQQAQLDLLDAGARPEQVRAAEAQVAAAEGQVDAAAGQVNVAEAGLAVIDEQLAKLTITAPISGTVLNRAIQPGEIAQPGGALLTLGNLNDLTLTVYVPEDRYGAIRLDEPATVSVDSFPGESFAATVRRIADQAEFTPRNVQTAEGRKTTVFAVELAVENTGNRLKPGMPADVTFGE